MSYERIAWLPQHRVWPEQEIDGLACGIHGSVQISVLPFDPDVRFHRRDSHYWSASGERGSAGPVLARRFGPSARSNWSGSADHVPAPSWPCAQRKSETSGTTAHTRE